MPLIYLYVKHLSDENYAIRKRISVHFVAAALFLASTTFLIFQLNSGDRALVFSGEIEVPAAQILFLNYVLASFAIIFQVFFYSIRMFRLLYKHSVNVERFYSYKENLSLKWLKIFVGVYFFYYLFEFTVFLFKGINISESVYFSIISLHVFFVGFMGLKQRDIYKKMEAEPSYELDGNSSCQSQDENDDNTQTPLRKPAILTPEFEQEVIQKIGSLMTEKKLFLKSDLSLYDLASELDINRNYLSNIINEAMNTNFYNLINGYRIEEAKKMLVSDDFQHLSIEGIATSAGFKSRSVFYPVFKKMVGMTPAEFKKQKS